MEERHRRALVRTQSCLVKDLKAEDVTVHLLSREVINEDDLDAINSKATRRERVSELLRLLPKRGPKAFPVLVDSLRLNYDWLAKELESNLSLLNDSRSATAAEAVDDMLRKGAVPSLPACHITRLELVTKIRGHLGDLKGDQVLGVHGMPGIGKSVCVNEALRDADLLQDRFPGGVYWLGVGQVDHEGLLNKMQALCERLSEDGSPTAQPPTNIEVAKERLRKLLNKPQQPCLLVLDDVWKADVLAVFDLGACVAVTTRDSSVFEKMDRCYYTVQMQDGFSETESQELFAKRLKMSPESLPKEAIDIHLRCRGSPMMIALLSSYLSSKTKRRESTDRWRMCLDILRDGKHEKLPSNFIDAIRLSVKSLDEKHHLYFRSLAVFGADIGIPCKVLCTYWDMSMEDVEDTMDMMVKKSLVQEMQDARESMVYGLHDLIVDYMAIKYTPEEKAQMHAKLVERYLEECDNDYSRLPDDEYIMWFIGHHVYRSSEYQLLPKLYFDLGFVGNKLRVTGPSDLLSDYRKYGEFMDKDSNDNVTRRRDFENFVRTAGHLAARLSKAGDPTASAAAVVQLALCQPDSSEVYREAIRLSSTSGDQLYLCWKNKEAMRWSNVLLTKLFSGSVYDVVFTHEENLVLAAYGDGNIKLWNMLTGDEYSSFHGHTERVNQLTVNPDGDRFVSASEDHTLKIWDLQSAIQAAQGTGDCHLMHDVSSGQRTPSPRIRHSSSSAFFSDPIHGSGCVTVRQDESEQTLQGHGTAVACVDWSPDGQSLLSGADDGGVKMWDIFGEAVHNLPDAHGKNVTCCSFSPNGDYFATGSADGRVRLWMTSDASLLYNFSQHNLRVTSLSLSRDNNSIVSVADKEIFMWVWSNDRRPSLDFVPVQMSSSSLDQDLYLCSRLSHDQRQLVVGTSSNMYMTWDLLERRVISTQRGFAGSVTSLVFSHDGERLLAGAGDTVTSCSLTTAPKLEDSLQPLFSARFVTSSAGRQSLVVAAITSNNGIQVLRGMDGKIIKTTKPAGEKIIITKMNEAGTMVAFGCEDGSVGVYDIPPESATGTPGGDSQPNILGKHMDRVIALEFGPENTVVSGSEDKTMKVWWPDKTSVSCGGNDGAVTQVGLYRASDHGLIAVSCSRDGTLKVYRADTGKPLMRYLAHSGSTVTCYQIVRSTLPPPLPLVTGTNGAGAATRERSPCPPDLMVVTAAVDGEVTMSNLSTGEQIKTFKLGAGPVRTFQLTQDGQLLITGHDDGTVLVTRTDMHCQPRRLLLHDSMVNDLAVSPDGLNIISLGDSLAWWRLPAPETTASPRGRRQSQGKIPQSPRLTPPQKRYFAYSGQEKKGNAEPPVFPRQVFSFRGTLARRLAVSDDWNTVVTIDDAGVLYVLQVMAPGRALS